MNEREFEFEGKNYKVRSWEVDSIYKVRVFFDGKPANGYCYTVEIEDNIEAKKGKYPVDLLKDLMELAEQDIKEKKWERYCEIVEEVD